MTARKIAVRVLATLTLVVVFAIGYWPVPVDRGVRSLLGSVLDRLAAAGAPGWVDYAHLEFGANIVMFVPLGVLIALLLPRWEWWLAPIIGLALSLAIEFGQALLLPERFATPLDVLANTTGATIGALVVTGFRIRGRATAHRLPTSPP
ncbi:VanZ family protein [Labedella populi]|uniref:VanZ family protein n=1 Tax=Labedella populi TaxID=2498850 RepID=A0A3S5CPC5_9MICO|nr:VanZ family protein [Labedella populi]RWZ68445.1 VanZ family protein [Labedella populi]